MMTSAPRERFRVRGHGTIIEPVPQAAWANTAVCAPSAYLVGVTVPAGIND